jgi:hypothetical protein
MVLMIRVFLPNIEAAATTVVAVHDDIAILTRLLTLKLV